MIDPVDIKLFRDQHNCYDIDINEDGDIAQEFGYDTAILLSLFMEMRASTSEQPVPELRRGWWGNLNNNDQTDEWGSKIWLHNQARSTTEALEANIGFAQQSLNWMIEDSHCQSITFDGRLTLEGQALDGIFKVSPDEIETRNFNLWEFTGNGN